MLKREAEYITVKGQITKAELEKIYQFSPSTRKRLMNKELFDQLRIVGYTKECQFITTKVLQKLIDLIGPPEVKIYT